ncbi:MAG: hypothetical protein JNL08_01610 [Planctomycetes bacterium]|nr:hypothetical protein [Planctomycetota bacterium]
MNARHLTPWLSALVGTAASLLAQDPPNVVRLSPPHLADAVDPLEVTSLVVQFDRAMDPTAYALCGGGPSFPKVAQPNWESEQSFVIDAALEPDRVYAMDLSCAESGGFRSRDGGRLPLVPWRIATKGPELPAGATATAAARLFAALRERYSYRDRLGIDWTEVDRTHRDRLEACRSGAAFALHTGELLAIAQDVHVTVRWRDADLPTCRRRVLPNFDVRGLQRVLPKPSPIGRIGLAARTDDGIGYLLVGTFAREQRDDFDRVLDALRGLRDCKVLVLDVRTNGGGDELLARRLAAFFVEGEVVYAAQRVVDPNAEDGFGPRQDRRMTGNEAPDTFAGPVAVLTGPACMSSCEAFLLMMKQSPRAVLVGAPSFGSSGNPQPIELMSGLTVLLPSWQALRPDGSCFEGEGIAPHLHVAAEPGDFATGDPVLEAALQRLRGR